MVFDLSVKVEDASVNRARSATTNLQHLGRINLCRQGISPFAALNIQCILGGGRMLSHTQLTM